eukprot:6205743-Pleurochrysis_carterae.AAC.2
MTGTRPRASCNHSRIGHSILLLRRKIVIIDMISVRSPSNQTPLAETSFRTIAREHWQDNKQNLVHPNAW